MVCDELVYDFGPRDGSQASGLSHEFTLKNTGSREVHIVKKTATCTCTSAQLSADTIPPGGSTKLAVSANWGDREGRQIAGVTLVTDESPRAAIQLRITGWIANEAAVLPKVLDFGELPPGRSAQAKFFEVQPTSPGAAPFAITELSPADPSAVEITRVGSSSEALGLLGGPGRFAVRVIVPPQEGSTWTNLSVRTTSRPAPSQVLVRFRSTGIISTVPRSVFFHIREAESARLVSVKVRLHSGERGGRLQARLIADGGALAFAIADADLEHPSGDAAGTVSIRCDKSTGGTSTARLRLSYNNDFIDIPVAALVAIE